MSSNNAYPGDVIFTQRGTLGQVGVIPAESRFPRYVVSQSQMKLTVNPAKADARFVYYFFRHPDTVQTVKNRAITSGVPHINLGILREFEMPLPPLDTQREIVATLADYDELTENNRQRMALLEESARLLYGEWFLRLHFPVTNTSVSPPESRKAGSAFRLKMHLSCSVALIYQNASGKKVTSQFVALPALSATTEKPRPKAQVFSRAEAGRLA